MELSNSTRSQIRHSLDINISQFKDWIPISVFKENKIFTIFSDPTQTVCDYPWVNMNFDCCFSREKNTQPLLAPSVALECSISWWWTVAFITETNRMYLMMQLAKISIVCTEKYKNEKNKNDNNKIKSFLQSGSLAFVFLIFF